MNGKEKSSERERRDWVIILIILLFGFLCVILAGQWAVRFSPTWKLDTSMQSNLDPDSDFLTNKPVSFFEPLDPSILTQPAWVNIFLTPGVTVEPRTPPPADTPVGTNTPVPTLFISPTPVKPTNTPTVIIATPTNTSPYFPPPPSTRTSTPPVTPLSANLQITMSDGSTSYVVGGTITYTITVYNLIGPSNVNGATVTDNFPAVLSNITWTCAVAGGATCPANGTGNINASVNLPVGSSVTFTVNADVSPAATNNPLANTATVTLPGGISDPDLANNTVTDNDTPVFNVNLQVTKTDSVISYTPGSPLTYTIAVANTGPANVIGATVIDIFDAIITSVGWTCAPAGGATCPASGNTNINNIVNIPDGGSVTYTVNASTDVNATTNLVNTVTVNLSTIYNNTGNNSATDTDTPLPTADLGISKTDGVTTVNPGDTVTYTIRVTNGGPVSATGAILSDPVAIGLTKTAVACSTAPGQCVTPPSIAELQSGTFALPVLNNGQFYEITVSALVTATSGSVTNTATIVAPTGITDPIAGNDSASDTNTVNLVADLSISKTSGTMNYSANEVVLYTITVSNAGPAPVTGATVTDGFSANILIAAWSCTPSGGASCPPIGAGTINDTVNIPVGASVTYNVLATVISNPSGNLDNTAIVATPTGVTDPNPGNDSSTYTHIANVDVQVTKDDGSATYTAGGTTTYTITVTNNSTFNLTGVTLTDNIPSLITNWTWVCTSQNGGASGCDPSASNSSNFTDTINLAANGSNIVYTVTANIHPSAAGDLVNTATVAVPSGYVDSVPGNNSATDSDINQVGEPEIGPPDGGSLPIGDGGSVTFYLNQPIVANGDASPDFIFYEVLIGTDIFLDQVIIDISTDGITWYRVFFWGDATADTNTNVNNSIPPINGLCATEVDNCQIPSAFLYNGNTSGITVDVDNSPFGAVPGGNYYWIRFTEPGMTPGDGTHVDSIQIITP